MEPHRHGVEGPVHGPQLPGALGAPGGRHEIHPRYKGDYVGAA